MAKIWSSLFGGGEKPEPEKRMSQDDWALQWMKYAGVEYPLFGGYGNTAYGGQAESVEGNFEGYVQQAMKANGIVYACMVARMRLFSQARFQFQRMRKGRPGDLFGTKELEVFETPWPGAGTGNLTSKAITHADLGGNHYAYRDGKRIRVLRPDWVDIILTADPKEAVDTDVAGWVYRPGGTDDRSKWEFFVAGDWRFAHWAPTPDPEAQYRGMSWLTPVIREIIADKAATKHKSKFFDNAATPSFAISFKETVTAEQFKMFKSAMQETHQGADNAYKPMYIGGGADITPLTYDMKQLDFKNTQGAGETRIAMAARIHPVILGASEGMQGAGLNAGNFRQAKDAWADGEIRPLWESLCQSYSALVDVPSDARLWYDDRDISFLREDVQDKMQRLQTEAAIIADLVMQGFKQDSVIEALTEGGDWQLLKHTGLFSVQLQPPMPEGPPTKVVDQNGKPVKATGGPAKPAGTPGKPGAAGKPAGQPRTPTKKPATGGRNDGPGPEEEARKEDDSAPEAGREAEAGSAEAAGQEGRSPEEAAPEEEVTD